MAYHQFALVYDELMKEAPYDDWAIFTEQVLFKKAQNPHEIVELGCGTGEVAIRLSKKGYKLIGIDNSDDMLSIAQKKSIDSAQQIDWINQDIRNLSGFDKVDVCISFCDVMNYITTESDLLQVFQHVHQSLTDKGLFIFDVHDLSYVQHNVINFTFTDVTDDLTYIWECEGDPSVGDMTHYLTFFKRVGDMYTRFSEIHHQKVFPITFYEELLKSIGFSKIEIYSDFNLENDHLPKNRERNFIIAEK